MGEYLALLFSENGIGVLQGGRYRNKLLRLMDMLAVLILNSRKYDFALIETFSGTAFVWGFLSALCCRLLGKKYILDLKGGNLPAFSRKMPRLFQFTFSGAAAIAAPSAYLENWVRGFGFSPVIIPNPIDLENYTFKQRNCPAPRLLWVRRFHDIYNPAMAVRVLKELQQKFPSAILTMAGPDNGELEPCRRLAEELGLSRAVRFLGLISKVQINALGQEHDIFINTTHFDNTPFTMVEAAAMGLPQVATRVGGIPDLFKDEETALLVDDGDAEGMAQAVTRLLENASLSGSLSVNAHRLVEDFSKDRILAVWKALFTRLSG